MKKVELLREMATPALLPIGVSSMPQEDAQCSFSGITSAGIQQGDLNATPPPGDSGLGKDQSLPSTAHKETHDTNTSLENKEGATSDLPSQPKWNKRQAAKELFPANGQKGQKKE